MSSDALFIFLDVSHTILTGVASGDISGDIIIPPTVKVIAEWAFYNCQYITSVTIPDSVTTIEPNAFRQCMQQLKTVTMGNSVTSIGGAAFNECNVLESVQLSESLKHIGEGAFGGCYCLASINLPSGLLTIGVGAFSGTPLTSITLPNTLESIGVQAFTACQLTHVVIPTSVEYIGQRVFQSCPIENLYFMGERFQTIDNILVDGDYLYNVYYIEDASGWGLVDGAGFPQQIDYAIPAPLTISAMIQKIQTDYPNDAPMDVYNTAKNVYASRLGNTITNTNISPLLISINTEAPAINNSGSMPDSFIAPIKSALADSIEEIHGGGVVTLTSAQSAALFAAVKTKEVGVSTPTSISICIADISDNVQDVHGTITIHASDLLNGAYVYLLMHNNVVYKVQYIENDTTIYYIRYHTATSTEQPYIERCPNPNMTDSNSIHVGEYLIDGKLRLPMIGGPVGASPIIEVPSAPSDVTVSYSVAYGTASATVSWTAPQSDGGATIDAYTVDVSANGSSTQYQTSGAVSCAIVFQTGVLHTITVKAHNSVGYGALSLPASFTPYTVPKAVSNIQAVGGRDKVKLSWSAPIGEEDGNSVGTEVLRYDISYCVTGAVEATVISNVQDITRIITGLQIGVSYTFTVYAKNRVDGTSIGTTVQCQTNEIYTFNGTTITGATENMSNEMTLTDGNLIIPTGITSINDSAFQNISTIINVTIPSGVTGIGNYAFSNCANLTSMSIPSSITYFRCLAISSCYNLRSIIFGGNAPGFDSPQNTNIIYDKSPFVMYYMPEFTTSWNSKFPKKVFQRTWMLSTALYNSIPVKSITAIPSIPTSTNVTSYVNSITSLTSSLESTNTTISTSVINSLTTAIQSTTDATSKQAITTLLATHSDTAKGIMEAQKGGSVITLSAKEAAAVISTLPTKDKSTTALPSSVTSFSTYIPAAPVGAGKPSITIGSSASPVDLSTTGIVFTLRNNVEYDITINGVLKTVTYNKLASPNPSTLIINGSQQYTAGTTVQWSSNTSFYIYSLGTSTFIPPDATNTNVPCFPAGTKLLTTAGYKAVESLTPSDAIVTADGRAVKHTLYSRTIPTATTHNAPYSICANAFGPSSPRAATLLSPLHAIQSKKGVWQIPQYAATMYKGVTQYGVGEKVTYYHVELPNYFTDNIVLEGGVVVESFGAKQTAGMTNVYKWSTALKGFTRASPAKARVTRK